MKKHWTGKYWLVFSFFTNTLWFLYTRDVTKKLPRLNVLSTQNDRIISFVYVVFKIGHLVVSVAYYRWHLPFSVDNLLYEWMSVHHRKHLQNFIGNAIVIRRLRCFLFSIISISNLLCVFRCQK